MLRTGLGMSKPQGASKQAKITKDFEDIFREHDAILDKMWSAPTPKKHIGLKPNNYNSSAVDVPYTTG